VLASGDAVGLQNYIPKGALKMHCILATIQIAGVFLASLFGLACILKATRKSEEITFGQFSMFALGMAMAMSKLFL